MQRFSFSTSPKTVLYSSSRQYFILPESNHGFSDTAMRLLALTEKYEYALHQYDLNRKKALAVQRKRDDVGEQITAAKVRRKHLDFQHQEINTRLGTITQSRISRCKKTLETKEDIAANDEVNKLEWKQEKALEILLKELLVQYQNVSLEIANLDLKYVSLVREIDSLDEQSFFYMDLLQDHERQLEEIVNSV